MPAPWHYRTCRDTDADICPVCGWELYRKTVTVRRNTTASRLLCPTCGYRTGWNSRFGRSVRQMNWVTK